MDDYTQDRSDHGPVYRFLSALARGIHKLIAANLICFIVSLPVITWFYLLINTYLNAYAADSMTDLLPGLGYFCSLLLLLPEAVFYPLLLLSALLWGPVLMGLTYVARGIVSGRHVWLSDLFGQARANARQGVAVGVATVVVFHILLWNIFSGLTAASAALTAVLLISKWGSALLLVLCLLALPYIYLIAVSIRQPLRQVVRNAVILARVRLGRGLLLLLGLGLYWWGTSSALPAASLLALPFVSLSLTACASAGVCFPLVDRHILEPARNKSFPTGTAKK